MKAVMVAILAVLGLTSCVHAQTSPGERGASAGLVTLPSKEIEILLGPLTKSGRTPFDHTQLTQARRFSDALKPADHDNFYDTALAWYTLYYRTGDAYWLGKARAQATAVRDWCNNRDLPIALAGRKNPDPACEGLPAREYSSLGLAILALEMSDSKAREVVKNQSRAVERWYLGYMDPRETGYSLLALVAASLLDPSEPRHATNARKLVDDILARQTPTGEWQAEVKRPPPSTEHVRFTMNYMVGILMEGLMLYDRAFEDPRVLPAIRKYLDWAWATQWVPAAQAFQYTNANLETDVGRVSTTPHANLSGLLLPAWGYAYARTGEQRYAEQGNQIIRGMLTKGANEIWSAKQFTQMFRSSSRYLGYVALREQPR